MSGVVVSAEPVMICCARVDAEAARTLQSTLEKNGCPAATLICEPQSPERTVHYTACRVVILLCSAITHRINDLWWNVNSAERMGAFVLSVILEPCSISRFPQVMADRSFPDEQIRAIFDAIAEPLHHGWSVPVRWHVPTSCELLGRRTWAAFEALQKASVGRLRFEMLPPGAPPAHGDHSIFVYTGDMAGSLPPPFDDFDHKSRPSSVSSAALVTACDDRDLVYSNVIMLREPASSAQSPWERASALTAAQAFIHSELVGTGRSVISWNLDLPQPKDVDKWLAEKARGILLDSLLTQMVRLRPPKIHRFETMDLETLACHFNHFRREDWLLKKWKAAEVEARFLLDGKGNLGPWKYFRRLLQPGDELWSYGHEQNAEGMRCSQSYISGLAILRDGEFIADWHIH